MIDILFVTYNSEKWVENCIKSIADSDFDLEDVSLIFVDNCSSDHTRELLNDIRARYDSRFADIQLFFSNENLGFGRGNNKAASIGNGEILFCLNIDTSIYRDTLACLYQEIEKSGPDIGLWELRQFPYEHPKFYDPVTGITSWSSGACFAIKRSLFERLGGFDENIFMYAEDVDLSWRVRLAGYSLKYVPKAIVNHYSYESAGQIKPNQYVYSIINNLYLRYKFGTDDDIAEWNRNIQQVYQNPEPFNNANAMLRNTYSKTADVLKTAREWHDLHEKELDKSKFRFFGWDYEMIRDGAFYENERPKSKKMVTVVVRTCGRPNVLRETLLSLRAQTYPNIQIVVVEDGENKSADMITKEFSDLQIVYRATGQHVGRCKVGNIGLSIAEGDYINFLDDDDVFFPDHVEVLVSGLERNPSYRIVYSLAFDTPIRIKSLDPYIYELSVYNGTLKNAFNRLELIHHNLFPIQAIMFERGVYEELGGFDESLDVLEDWELWVRFATKYPFYMIYKTTSIYRVPADRKIDAERQKKLDEALAFVRKKQDSYMTNWKVGDLYRDEIAMMERQRIELENNLSLASVNQDLKLHGLIYRGLRKIYHWIKNRAIIK